MTNDAIKHYQDYFKMGYSSSTAEGNMGYLYLEKNDPEEALIWFKKSVHSYSKEMDSQLGLAITCYLLNDDEKALSSFRKAVKLEPDLLEGIAGIDGLKAKGYFYTTKQKKVLRKLFQQYL